MVGILFEYTNVHDWPSLSFFFGSRKFINPRSSLFFFSHIEVYITYTIYEKKEQGREGLLQMGGLAKMRKLDPTNFYILNLFNVKN